MSRHTVIVPYKGVTAEVVIGWDRPMQGFHGGVYCREPITLDDEEEPLEEGDIIWSNLYLPPTDAHPQVLTGFLQAFEELGITLPVAVVEAVEHDKAVNRGNHDVSWSTEGVPQPT